MHGRCCIAKHLLWHALKSLLRFLTVLSISVWSDDDWLKKFSGKTLEEAEAEAEAGETTKTAAQEVNQVSLHALALNLLYAVMCGSCPLHVFIK